MRAMIERLPETRMKWKYQQIIPNSGTSSKPIFLYYRNPVAAVRSLLDRPALAPYMNFVPERQWKDQAMGQRRYSEILTGDWAWETQVRC